MKLMKWTWKQWTALSLILLVLVISYLAYSIFVPKLAVLEKAQAKLQKYTGEREDLLDVKVPKPISAEEKKALAMEVPVSLEQSRFIRMLRDAEQEAGVVINSLSFLDPNGNGDDKSAADAKNAQSATPKTNTAKTSTAKTSTAKNSAAASSIAAASTLDESTGKLLVSGDYQQVRKFFERFNQMERLVTFKKWTLSTEEVRDQTVSITTRSVPVYPPNAPQATPATPTQTQSQSLASPSRDDLLKALESLNRPLLEERTPLYTQQEYDRVVESVMAKLVLSYTQRDKDLANLEIQQATNRYQAGQEGKKEAVSIVDQEKTGDYVPGANTNIREVVLGSTAVSSPGVTNQPGATANANASPLYFLNIPSTITPSNKLLKVVVKVEIEFTIYQAPGAKLVLPALDALSEYKPFYEPTLRSNPVESN